MCRGDGVTHPPTRAAAPRSIDVRAPRDSISAMAQQCAMTLSEGNKGTTTRLLHTARKPNTFDRKIVRTRSMT